MAAPSLDRRELMRWEAENRVVHGGTYTGSPLGPAAAVAVLGRIEAEPDLYDDLERRSRSLAEGIEDVFSTTGVDGHVRRVGSMLQPFLAARPAEEPRDVNEAHRYPLGRWFVSLSHGAAEIEETLEAVRGAVEDLGP